MTQFILGVNIRFISAMIPVSVFRTDNNFTDRRNFDMGAVDTVFCSVVAIADFRFQNLYAGNQRLGRICSAEYGKHRCRE